MFRPAKKEEFSFDMCQYSKSHLPTIFLLAITSVGLTAVAVATRQSERPVSSFDVISTSMGIFLMLYAAMLHVGASRARIAHEAAIKQDASPRLCP